MRPSGFGARYDNAEEDSGKAARLVLLELDVRKSWPHA